MKTSTSLSALVLVAACGWLVACGDDTGSATSTSGAGGSGGEGDGGGNSPSASSSGTGTPTSSSSGGTPTSSSSSSDGGGTPTSSSSAGDGGAGGGGNCEPGPEDNEAACNDGCSNDDDDFADCDDFDCQDFCPAPPAENSNVTCTDGEDNDRDGDTDCDDEDCAARAACDGTTFEGETGSVLCTNGINDDASKTDTFTDCADFSCSDDWEVVQCQDLPIERNSNALCGDGDDNDRDGQVDCQDFGCTRLDGDTIVAREGIVVCDGNEPSDIDPDDIEAVTDAVNAECSDGIDNDNNNAADCEDFGCKENPLVTVCDTEVTDAACSDGVDNDENGFADCDAFSCQGPTITVCPDVESNFANCTDSLDNDGNGFADCDDNKCKDIAAACGPVAD